MNVSARDRLVLLGLGVIAVLGAVWIMAVSPARKQASKASGEVSAARAQLAQAQTEAVEARSAVAHYRAAYASLAQLGQAVPVAPEVPSLVFALDKASHNHRVHFSSISPGSSGGSSSSSSSSATGAAAPAPFTQMPVSLTFAGSYSDLIHLLGQIERFTVQVPGGQVEVSGRLLTIQSISLSGGSGTSASSSTTSTTGGSGGASASTGEMTWTITATAYVLAPSAQASAPPAPGGTATSGASTGASPTATPAVVQVNG